MVLQYERKSSENEDITVSINAIYGNRGAYPQAKGFTTSGRDYRKFCTHYGKIEHLVDVCYKKNGFPPRYEKFKGNTSVNVATETEDERDDATLTDREDKEKGMPFPFIPD
ncbi:hypothetical protein VNO77_44347 [Canavalia gladiata]|uniref:Uncharacterized protein n=1 Tax=Canavalia gladiata TaxID=3824 RepID=A0AAN9PQY4_CANGL